MKRGEGVQAAVGACMVLGLCSPLLLPITLTALTVSDVTPCLGVSEGLGCHGRATSTIWGHIQRNVDNSRQGSDFQNASKEKLLYHVAIGSNCNKEVLEGRRNVTPRKSMPCRIEGYSLLFSHRGLPYWEPSFCTIAPADEVEMVMAEETNGGALEPAAQVAPTLAGQNGTSSSNGGASLQDGGSSRVRLTNGHARCHANGRANTGAGSPATGGGGRPATSGRRSSAWRCLVSMAGRSLASLGGLLLAEAPLPSTPRLFRTPDGRPALHGVVHQISEADMAQIQATEGGGGNQKMGYKLEEMTCTLYDGSTVQALGFTTHPCSQTCPSLVFAHPSQRYLQIVQVGIASSGIDTAYLDWLKELQPYRRDSLGQLLGAYVVVAVMLSAGVVVGAGLSAYRLVTRRKLDGYYLHIIIQYIMGAVWWLHNHVLSRTFGRGC